MSNARILGIPSYRCPIPDARCRCRCRYHKPSVTQKPKQPKPLTMPIYRNALAEMLTKRIHERRKRTTNNANAKPIRIQCRKNNVVQKWNTGIQRKNWSQGNEVQVDRQRSTRRFRSVFAPGWNVWRWTRMMCIWITVEWFVGFVVVVDSTTEILFCGEVVASCGSIRCLVVSATAHVDG